MTRGEDAGHSTRRAVRHRRAAPARLRRAEPLHLLTRMHELSAAAVALVEARRHARRSSCSTCASRGRSPSPPSCRARRRADARDPARRRARSGAACRLHLSSRRPQRAGRRIPRAQGSPRPITSPAGSTPGRARSIRRRPLLTRAPSRRIQGTAWPMRAQPVDDAPRGACAAVPRPVAASPRGAAQSLLELYEAAHGYDATYLAARALADSAPYRVEQVRALMRPSASLSASAPRASRPTRPSARTSAATGFGLTRRAARQPLFNRANDGDDRAGRANARVVAAPSSTPPSRT